MSGSARTIDGFGYDDRYDDGWETGISDHEVGPVESERQHIPPRLDEMAPSPVLAVFLSNVDTERLTAYDRVVVLRARQRMASHYAAQVYTDMVAVRDAYAEERPRWGDVSHAESAAAEVRSALHLTRRAADTELSLALDLHERLPQVLEMLDAGLIDVRRAKTIDRGTYHLSIATARTVVERIADVAPRLTAGELAARIKKLCIEANQYEASERYERAVEDRKVIARPTVDGTANLLGLDLPPDKVAAISRRINKIARSLRSKGETRSMDQLRADIFVDLLQGRKQGGGSQGVVHLTADLGTLSGLTEHPGELNGFAPVISDIARQVAEEQQESEWRYTISDTETGHALFTGTTRRRPTAPQRRRIESRHPTCVYPGCRMPATESDLDHTTSWAEGGTTTDDNLAPLCRNDHGLKHNGWSYKVVDDDEFVWTSPLGHTYVTEPAPPRPDPP